MRDEAEIESILVNAKKILDERPELRLMDIDAVLDELDDGTSEMKHNYSIKKEPVTYEYIC